MRQLVFLIPFLLPITILAGCNTPEALIPRAEVGNGGGQSTASATEYGDGGGQSANVYSEPAPQQGYASAPQNTLEAQAQALAAGQSTGTPPPGTPIRAASATQQPLPPPVTSQAPAQQQQTIAAANLATTADTIRFLPIIGAPVEAVTPLSRQLGAEARARGLSIKGSSDPSTRHILKGYFSAFADSGNVNVVYVWDVLDGSGARLHRIQGQQSVRSSATDPWAGVPASVMQQIGSKTIAEYIAWKQSTSG